MSLCTNQDNFNDAFYKALKYSRKTDDKAVLGPVAIYLLLHVIFLIWAVILAFKSAPPENRVIHITLAMVFAPAYVLAYYINAF